MYNFTPVSALIGGVIIGLSVVLYFYSTGRLAGISGIFENAISNSSKRTSNVFMLYATRNNKFVQQTEPLIMQSKSWHLN